MLYRKRHTFRQAIVFRLSAHTGFRCNRARAFISRPIRGATTVRHDGGKAEPAYLTVVLAVRGCGTPRTYHPGRLRLDRASLEGRRMVDVKTADRELQTYIRPQTFPVAIRMLRPGEPIPERARRPARDFKKLSMNCQVIDMARRYGWTIALTREDTSAPSASPPSASTSRRTSTTPARCARACTRRPRRRGRAPRPPSTSSRPASTTRCWWPRSTARPSSPTWCASTPTRPR